MHSSSAASVRCAKIILADAGCERRTPLRIATIRQSDGEEEAALALPDGLAPVDEVYDLSNEDADLLSLLRSGRFYELKEAYGRGEL